MYFGRFSLCLGDASLSEYALLETTSRHSPTSGAVTPGLQRHLLQGSTAGAANTSSVLSETGNEPEGAAGVLCFPNNRTDRGASGVTSLCVSHQEDKKRRAPVCKRCSWGTMQFLLQHPMSLNYKLSPCGAAEGEEGGVRSNNSSPG